MADNNKKGSLLSKVTKKSKGSTGERIGKSKPNSTGSNSKPFERKASASKKPFRKFSDKGQKDFKRKDFKREDGSSEDRSKDFKRKNSHDFKRANKPVERSFDTNKRKPQQFRKSSSKEKTVAPIKDIRLNRYISNSGVCSRRDADELIASGQIKVNGTLIQEMGYRVKRSDNVEYKGKILSLEKPVYALLNKPKDFITTMEDTHDRKTVMDLVKIPTGERVYPVGRLDRQTTGLLLFTNDGDLAKKLSHPSGNVTKLYEVHLDRDLTKNDFQEIAEGITLEDGGVQVDDIAYVGAKKNVIGISIHSGRNRIVRRIFEYFDYKVTKLDRVMFAGLTKKDVPRGKWRLLTEAEIRRLKYF